MYTRQELTDRQAIELAETMKYLDRQIIEVKTLKPEGNEAERMIEKGINIGAKFLTKKATSMLPKLPKLVPTAITAVGKFFGFSRPMSDEVTKPVKIVPAQQHVNVQGLEVGTNFGLDMDNGIKFDSAAAGTDIDEMSFEALASRPNYIGGFTVSTSDPVGKAVALIPIWPFGGRTRKSSAETQLTRITLSRIWDVIPVAAFTIPPLFWQDRCRYPIYPHIKNL